MSDTDTGGTLHCQYCDTDELVYELQSARGQAVRCIPCLAIERGNQQINMSFDRFVDFETDGIVWETDEEKRESRKNSYEVCRSWWCVLGRIRQDDAILKRDSDDYGAIHDWTREFLTNLMGSAAYYSPSEIIESDGDPEQSTLTDGGRSVEPDTDRSADEEGDR